MRTRPIEQPPTSGFFRENSRKRPRSDLEFQRQDRPTRLVKRPLVTNTLQLPTRGCAVVRNPTEIQVYPISCLSKLFDTFSNSKSFRIQFLITKDGRVLFAKEGYFPYMMTGFAQGSENAAARAVGRLSFTRNDSGQITLIGIDHDSREYTCNFNSALWMMAALVTFKKEIQNQGIHIPVELTIRESNSEGGDGCSHVLSFASITNIVGKWKVSFATQLNEVQTHTYGPAPYNQYPANPGSRRVLMFGNNDSSEQNSELLLTTQPGR